MRRMNGAPRPSCPIDKHFHWSRSLENKHHIPTAVIRTKPTFSSTNSPQWLYSPPGQTTYCFSSTQYLELNSWLTLYFDTQTRVDGRFLKTRKLCLDRCRHVRVCELLCWAVKWGNGGVATSWSSESEYPQPGYSTCLSLWFIYPAGHALTSDNWTVPVWNCTLKIARFFSQ